MLASCNITTHSASNGGAVSEVLTPLQQMLGKINLGRSDLSDGLQDLRARVEKTATNYNHAPKSWKLW